MIAATSEGICGVCKTGLNPDCGFCPCCHLVFMATSDGIWFTMTCEHDRDRNGVPWHHPHTREMVEFPSRLCEHRQPWCEGMAKLTVPDFGWSQETGFTVDGLWMTLVVLRDAGGNAYRQGNDIAREWRSGSFEVSPKCPIADAEGGG